MAALVVGSLVPAACSRYLSQSTSASQAIYFPATLRSPTSCNSAAQNLNRGLSAQRFRFGNAFRVNWPTVPLTATWQGVPRRTRTSATAVAVAGTPLRDEVTSNAEAMDLGSGGPDFFLLELTEALQEGEKVGGKVLAELAEASAEVVLGMRWPSNKDEAYRFTDLRPLRATEIVPCVSALQLESNFETELSTAQLSDSWRVVVVDGVLNSQLSDLEGLPAGVSVGSVAELADEVVDLYVRPHLGAPSGRPSTSLDLFTALNGVGAPDLGVILVPPGVVLRSPIHVVYLSTQGKRGGPTRAESSTYSLLEASLGGRISRHNLRIEQLGADTETVLDSFAIAGQRQVADLHSSVQLDWPRGKTRQLHKCIVTDASGHAVFDGNVRVNRLAQQTDAAQLSRSLLLVPRGTINVKPNLQIIADDVKCTHGAAISDLEDDQLFYFRARGIDEQTARSALVFSFCAEVVEKLKYSSLRRRMEESVKRTLSAAGAMDSSVAAVLGRGQE